MRRFLLLSFCSAALVALTHAQQTAWQWVNPLPQGNLINGMSSYNQDTAAAVIEYGTVIRTTNGGTTWQVEPTVSGVIEQLFAIQYASSTIVYAIGETGRALKSTDAGGSWSILTVPTLKDLYCMSFSSPTTGWVAGSAGTIFKTTDGGSTWNQQTSGTSVTIYSVHFKSDSIGWFAGTNGTVRKTTNGGATWVAQVSGTTQALYSINFASTSVGWIVGAFGTILRTINGGASWTLQPSGTPLSLFSVQFSSFLNGWAVGSYGIVLKSTNGGISWFEQTSGTYNDLYAVNVTSSTNGWAMGDLGTILHTTDGGTTWIAQSNGVKVTLNAINFPSTSTGFSVGEEGVIIKTTNAGLTWTPQQSGLYYSLYGSFFLDEQNGWVVGDSAVILHTTNGGSTWINQHSRTDPTLYSIHFPTTTSGWTVGDFGTILYSSNSGSQWIMQNSGTTTTLLAVRFFNAKIGWTAGYGGEILKTTDGGLTWSPQTSNTVQALYAIKVIDSSNVYASGDFGVVIHTTNGGATWTTLVTNADESLYSIDFYSPSLGWAVGDDGAIIATTDGGATWKYQNSMTWHTLWAVQVVKGTSGAVLFATGIGGTIVCSAVSPLPVKTWTGAFDSLWSAAGNWSPIGVPLKLDSVYIPPNSPPAVIKQTTQQINIGALTVGANARLSIYNGLSQFIIKDNVNVLGQFTVDQASNVQLVTGGDFFVGISGSFSPGHSTVYMTSAGAMNGTFYNILLAESSAVKSIGSINVKNSFVALANFGLRSVDTLTIQNPEANAFQGPGIFTAGTVKRAIKPGSTSLYRFESPGSYLRFYPNGTLPDTVAMTAYPHSLPSGLQDTLFVRRYYNIKATGGLNYLAFLSLRYDTSETAIDIYDLSLFRDSSGVLFNMNSPDYLDSDIVAVYADSVRKFSTWYFGRADYFPRHPFEFYDSLFLSDNGGITDTLYFGAVAGATDSIDNSLGEIPLGPPPSSGTYDVRWLIPPTQGTIVDMRDLLNVTNTQHVYTCRLQPGPGGYPFTVRWNKDAFALGSFFLRDQATHGGQFNIPMKVVNNYTITNAAITEIEVLHIPPVYFNVAQGWNITSMPLTKSTDGRKIHLFPNAVSNAFGYNCSSYYIVDTMKNGMGYWLKFNSAQAVPLDGTPRTLDTVNVCDGWNLIGSISSAVAVNAVVQVPAGIVTTQYFGYAGSYAATDSIRPSKGYWVKANTPGKLILSASEAAPKEVAQKPSPLEMLSTLNTITISDRNGDKQTIYFGTPTDPSFKASTFEMPPPPPGEAFDVRFSSGSMVQVISQPAETFGIDLRASAYPLTVQWHLAEQTVRSIALRDASQGTLLGQSSLADGSIRVTGSAVTRLNLQIDADVEVPKAFALLQNYPNPFNPSTVITFELPRQSLVTLTVYNILGQEVARLADRQDYPAGAHQLALHGENLSTGVYFYQLRADDGTSKEFKQVRKMLLMK